MKNLTIIKSFHTKIWDEKDLSAIDEFFATDALIHSPVRKTQGTSDMKKVISLWHQAFPNLKVYWDDFICEGDKVVSRWHAKGQQEGDFLDYKVSKKEVNYSGVTIYQLDNGMITEYWTIVDMETLKEQLKG